MRHDETNKRSSAPSDRGDQSSPAQQGDGGNIASFLQNLTSKDFQEALLAQNPPENVSRGVGSQAYCDASYAGEHMVVRFSPGFNPTDHKNEANAQNIVYMEPEKGKPPLYYNCLINCHYDNKGNLVGTPAHAEKDRYNHINIYPNPYNQQVTFSNHLPKDMQNHSKQRNRSTTA